LGLLDNAGNTHFNVGWGGSDVDDLGFTSTLIDSLAEDYKIDLDRVYSTGMSNGGFMSYHLACNLSNKIAAIASVTGSMSIPTYNQCNPERPVPILEIHGTFDPVVPFNGAIFAKPIDDVITFWQANNQCSLNPQETPIEDINPNDGSTVIQYVYSECDAQVNTELFKITGGGHTWPGNKFNTPTTNYDIDASLEVWKFFNRYDINGLRSTTSNKIITKKKNNIFPNPCNGIINVENLESKVSNYTLFNNLGQIIQKGFIKIGHTELDLSSNTNGIYLLKIDNEMHSLIKL
jgi:polyhydroxybutyrate depolymerase